MATQKAVFNFFADVGETIVFGKASPRVPLPQKNILNFFADIGVRILNLPGTITRVFHGSAPPESKEHNQASLRKSKSHS